MPLRVILNGALGRMGSEIGAIALEDPSLRLVAAVEKKGHPCIGRDFGVCIGKDPCGVTVASSLDPACAVNAVIIDFSDSRSTAGLIRLVRRMKTRLVIGTTGLTAATLSSAIAAAKRMPVLVSPNMSPGVNLLFSLTELASRRLKNDFDIEVIEAHHRFKKDAPSGTARRLGEIIVNSFGLPYSRMVRNGRSGISPYGRPKNEVGMHALRGGDIAGDHTVLFAGMGERIELRHMAHSRTPLARGAVAAAKWIASRRPGFYSMKDVLGL